MEGSVHQLRLPGQPARANDSRIYRPHLDGLRGLCVLGVISSHMADQHAWSWLSGGLGVNVFFILSGYLITMLALREEQARGYLNFSAFYIRRTFRIFPLYFAVLLGYCGLLALTGWGSALRDNFFAALPYYVLYLQEISYAFDVIAADRPSPFAHSWSLGIEEKYYLVWPILAFGLWAGHARIRRQGTIVLLALFTLTQSLGRLHPELAAWRLEILLYPYSNILWGCLLAFLLEDPVWQARLRWLGALPGTMLCLLAFLSAQLAYHPLHDQFREIVILHALATTGLLASILTGGGMLARCLQARPAVFLGRISYGMYLVHGLGISAGQKIFRPGSDRLEWILLAYGASVLASVATAYLLAVTLEQPAIRLGRRWASRVQERASGTSAILEFPTTRPDRPRDREPIAA